MRHSLTRHSFFGHHRAGILSTERPRVTRPGANAFCERHLLGGVREADRPPGVHVRPVVGRRCRNATRPSGSFDYPSSTARWPTSLESRYRALGASPGGRRRTGRVTGDVYRRRFERNAVDGRFPSTAVRRFESDSKTSSPSNESPPRRQPTDPRVIPPDGVLRRRNVAAARPTQVRLPAHGAFDFPFVVTVRAVAPSRRVVAHRLTLLSYPYN